MLLMVNDLLLRLKTFTRFVVEPSVANTVSKVSVSVEKLMVPLVLSFLQPPQKNESTQIETTLKNRKKFLAENMVLINES